MSTLSQRLLSLRLNRRLSQGAVAEAAEITTRTYQRYEAGEREPNASVLIRMADLYGVTIDYLVGRTDEKN